MRWHVVDSIVTTVTRGDGVEEHAQQEKRKHVRFHANWCRKPTLWVQLCENDLNAKPALTFNHKEYSWFPMHEYVETSSHESHVSQHAQQI
jgi:hypothetical protein